MGQANKVILENRKNMANLNPSKGKKMKAKDVLPGMFVYLDNFKRMTGSFHEVLSVETMKEGQWVRITTPSILSHDANRKTQNDYPNDFEVLAYDNGVTDRASRRFKIMDPTTGGLLCGFDNITRDSAALHYGTPIKDEKHHDDLEVNESTRYKFHTGAGTTHGTVYRTA